MMGTMKKANRKNQSTTLSEIWKKFARTSVELAANSVNNMAKKATPKAVRLGLSRGRSSRLCMAVSPVYRASMLGHNMARVKTMPGYTTGGRKTSSGTV